MQKRVMPDVAVHDMSDVPAAARGEASGGGDEVRSSVNYKLNSESSSYS